MTEVFVIRNQSGHYWGKSKSWVTGSDPRAVLRVKHQDEGVNSLVELSAKDVELRGEVVAVGLSEKGEPMLTVSDAPLPEIAEPEAPGSCSELTQEAAADPETQRTASSSQNPAKTANGA